MIRQILLFSIAVIVGIVVLLRVTFAPSPLRAQDVVPASAAPASTPDDAKKRVVVIVVDPEAAQDDVVRELIAALEKNGIASTKPEVKVNPSDTSHDLTLVLGIKPSESYKKNVEELITGLADLKRVRRLRFAFKAKPEGPNEVSIEAGSNVPMTEVQLVQEYLAQQKLLPLEQVTVHQAAAKAGAAPAESSFESPPIRATLMQVKANWSQVSAGKEIETELRAALKDASVPSGLMDILPGSGPQILFAPNLVGLYSRANYAQFLAWLKANDLVGSSRSFGNLTLIPARPTPPGSPIMMGRMGPQLAEAESQISLSQDVNLEDVSTISMSPPPPFVKRQPQQRWQIRFGANDKGTTPISFERQLVITEQTRGSEEIALKRVLDQYRRSFQLPDGYVALIYANSSEASLPTPHPDRFDPILIIERTPTEPAATSVVPRLHLPDKVETLSERNSFEPRGGRGSNMMPPMMSAQSQPPGPKASGATEGASSQRATSTKKEARAPASKPEPVVVSFALKHLDATAAAETVKLLYPSPQINIAADTRTNQLLIRADQDTLNELKAVFEKLDQAPPVQTKDYPVATGDGQRLTINGIDLTEEISDVPLEQLRQEYTVAEKRTLDLARLIQKEQSQLPPGDPRLKPQRDRLRDAVQAAFTARQQLLQTEVVEFQQRALRIQQSIQLRNRIQDKIVERRVNDLLNPDLKWDANQIQAPAATAPVPPVSDSPFRPNPLLGTVSTLDPANAGAQSTNVLPDAEPKPEDVATMSDPRPVSAVAWMELTFAEVGPGGKELSSAQYLNGAVVSDDGLVACMLAPGNRESEILRMARRATLFVGDSYEGVQVETGRVVAYESTTGLALIQCVHPPGRFLVPDSAAPAVNKQLYVYGKDAKESTHQSKQLKITDVSPAGGDSRFQVNFEGGEQLHGAALVDTAHRLQGILAQRVPPTAYRLQGILAQRVPTTSRPNPPADPLANQPPLSEPTVTSYAISGQDILALIARYRQSQMATNPAVGGQPIALDYAFPIRKAAPDSDVEKDARIDPALVGVWELTLPDGKPAPNGLRLVFLNDHLALFINGQRTSSWWVAGTDTQVTPHRIALLVCEGLDSKYGIYDIKGDGLRLNIGRDPHHKLTTFGTTRPEFRRVSTDVPAELRESMGQIPPVLHPLTGGAANSTVEPLQFQVILFGIEKQVASRMLTGVLLPINVDGLTKSTVLCSIPKDFDVRLRQLGQDGQVDIFSRPTIRTLMGQAASIEVGHAVSYTADQTGKLVPRQTGPKLEILPSRRIDSALQLDLSVQISEPAKSLAPVKEGDVILPGFNARAFRATVIVPADGQVLLACPSASDDQQRQTFVYIATQPTPAP